MTDIESRPRGCNCPPVTTFCFHCFHSSLPWAYTVFVPFIWYQRRCPQCLTARPLWTSVSSSCPTKHHFHMQSHNGHKSDHHTAKTWRGMSCEGRPHYSRCKRNDRDLCDRLVGVHERYTDGDRGVTLVNWEVRIARSFSGCLRGVRQR